ncbi:MAG: adenylate/guanylate cyclase domain-containing protein [bacterium]|nr:adenylate/guanylate cyclase domain-containing protein [bacterium]
MALPSGTVTFLFTDIEGSTALYRRLGDQYERLLERHNELLREVWGDFNGAEVKTEGDAFFVAFSSALDAVHACARAQIQLSSEPWPVDGVIRVRMGLHTGLASPRDGDYIAMAVHEAARISALGHGGQVVLSPSTMALVEGEPGAMTVDLGSWRIRDFDTPVRIHQLKVDGLPVDFPPLRTRPAQQHNLVAPQDSFLGRKLDLEGIGQQLSQARLVTLVGPGGVGKTRTAVEFGLRALDQWADGVWFVDLASTMTRGEMQSAVGEALSSTESFDEILDHLDDRQLLLILDNCEHVVDECAAMCSEILARSMTASILSTSREPLEVGAERLWRLAPLPDVVTARALFRDRATAVDPSAELDDSTIDRICDGLDRLPIAIEMAAARLRTMRLDDIEAAMDDRVRLLRSRRRDLDSRQRTIASCRPPAARDRACASYMGPLVRVVWSV